VPHEGDSERVTLNLRIRVSRDSGDDELWDFNLPMDACEFDPAVNLQAFVVIVRANIEEWWALRHREPTVAALAGRLE
jgi:hypothetical protein